VQGYIDAFATADRHTPEFEGKEDRGGREVVGYVPAEFRDGEFPAFDRISGKPNTDEMIDQLPTAVLVIDREGAVARANRKAATLLGAPAEQLRGRPLESVLAPPSKLAKALAGQACVIELAGPDGRTRALSCRASELLQGPWGLPTGYWLLTLELTDHCCVAQSSRDRRLMSTVVHELRQPLANLSAMLESSVDPSLRGDDEAAGLSPEHTHALLGEIRRLADILDGASFFERSLHSDEHHDVSASVLEFAAMFRRRAAKAGIDFVAEVNDLPTLAFDLNVLRSLVSNLVSNALEACEAGDRVELHLSLNPRRDALEVVVIDDGCGMDEELLARCLDRFVSTKVSGSGIGLALVRELVTAGGGELEIDSEAGAGTVVSLRLPLRPPS
jgi:signal transduction histidine kinase